MKFFSVDSPVFRFLQKFLDVLILNFMWLIFSIPIITVGASTVAAFSVAQKMVDEEEGYISKSFVKAFRENWKQGTILWIITVIAIYAIYLDFQFFEVTDGNPIGFLIIGILSIAVVVMGLIYAYPLAARYENSIKNILMNSMDISRKYFARTLILAAVIFFEFIIFQFNTTLIFFGILMGPGFIIFTIAAFSKRIFQKIEKEPGAVVIMEEKEEYLSSPLWDNELPIEKRLDYLINEMTLNEKLQSLTTGCPNIERLGVKSFYLGGEAAHGIEARHDQAFNAGEPEPTTSFAQPIGMSASFDRELIKKCGKAVGEEGRALYRRNKLGGLCRWAPTIDMERDPRWGRTEEAYGEDPFLTGEMASAYISGMRGEHPFYLRCGATLKHFYANNVEKDRIKASSSLDLRNKHEYYLEPFRKAIVEGGAEAIMTSYNEINGIPAIVDDEVQKIVKDTWGLPGHVVCDGGDMQQTVNDHKYFKTHAETVAYGLKAGIDCFTDDGEVVRAAASEALEKGLITIEDINRSIRNSFRTRIRLGLYDSKGDCPYHKIGEESLNSKEHQNIALRMAQEAIVLLKNEKQLLPLKPKTVKSMAVVGPMADVWYKDWYCGVPPYSVTPLSGIKSAYPDTEISYSDSLTDIQIMCKDEYVCLSGEDGRLKLGKKEKAETFKVIDWGNGSINLQALGNGLFVTAEEETFLVKASKKETFSWFIRENWNFSFKAGEQTQLTSWNGRKIGIDKEGYLTLILTDEPAIGEDSNHLHKVKRHILKDIEPAVFETKIVRDGIAEAVEKAKNAETAVVVIGCNPVINSKEEIDRVDLELPPMQQKLVDEVLSVNSKTVVVLISNYPYAINNIQKTASAILLSASGSQDLGTAIGLTLMGANAPAGRLNMTWYRTHKDLPDMNDYDIIKGKRTYQYFDKEVLYPFGYGLTYTDFDYNSLEATLTENTIKVKFKVKNIGKHLSDEVVQLYIRKEHSKIKQPIKKLVEFTRIKGLKTEEETVVEFNIPLEQLAYYDVISKKKRVEGGEYAVMVGSSSLDIRLQSVLMVSGEEPLFRNPYEWIESQCYDDYENFYLYQGHRDMVSLVTKDKSILSSALYTNVLFSKIPQSLKLFASADTPSKVEILLENTIIGSIEAESNQNYKLFETKLTWPQEIDTTTPLSLTLKTQGSWKIEKFIFTS